MRPGALVAWLRCRGSCCTRGMLWWWEGGGWGWRRHPRLLLLLLTLAAVVEQGLVLEGVWLWGIDGEGGEGWEGEGVVQSGAGPAREQQEVACCRASSAGRLQAGARPAGLPQRPQPS